MEFGLNNKGAAEVISFLLSAVNNRKSITRVEDQYCRDVILKLTQPAGKVSDTEYLFYNERIGILEAKVRLLEGERMTLDRFEEFVFKTFKRAQIR